MNLKVLGLYLLSLTAIAESGKFYVAAGAGTTGANATVYGTEITAGPNYSMDTQKLSKLSFAGQFQAGYRKNSKGFFLLAEVSTTTNTHDRNTSLFDFDGTPDETLTSTLSKSRTIGLSGKIGVPLNDKWDIFASLSLLNAKFKLQRDYTDPNPAYSKSSSKTKNAWGFAPGVGILYKPTVNRSIRLEYMYEMYKPIKAAQLNIPQTSLNGIFAAATLNATVKPRYHTTMLSFAYEI